MGQWPPVEAILLTWMSDSDKRESVHRNGLNLSAADSYLGHLYRVCSPEQDIWGYYSRDNSVFHPIGSYARARRALELAAFEAVK